MDLTTFLLGVAAGAAGALATGFFKRAGEDAYSWLKGRIVPSSLEHVPQVVVRIDSSDESSTPLGTTAVERVSSLTFKEIEKAIDSAPPLQQRRVAASYVGIRVEWDTYFRSGHETVEGKLRLRLQMERDTPAAQVLCEVSKEDYKELAILPAGAPIRVSGEIVNAYAFEVELKDARLQIK